MTEMTILAIQLIVLGSSILLVAGAIGLYVYTSGRLRGNEHYQEAFEELVRAACHAYCSGNVASEDVTRLAEDIRKHARRSELSSYDPHPV